MELEFCSDCKRLTETEFDHQSGDAICTECGLVLEQHYIDTTPEWRTFADADDGKDPSRVAPSTSKDPLLANDSELTTCINTKDIINKKDNDSSSPLFKRLKSVQQKQSLAKASQALERMATQLGLTDTVLNSSKALYKKADDKDCCKGRNPEAIAAACIFLASNDIGHKIYDLKHLASVTDRIKVGEIARVKELLIKNKVVDDVDKTRHATAEQLAVPCCNALGMDFDKKKAVLETLEKVKEVLDVRRKPSSVMAAVVYMIAQLSSDKATLKEIVQAADIAVNTVRKTCKDIYPHASKVIPDKFKQDLRKLCLP